MTDINTGMVFDINTEATAEPMSPEAKLRATGVPT